MVKATITQARYTSITTPKIHTMTGDSMITLTVVYCLTLNPTMCRELAFGKDDYSPITSLSECLIGGAMSSTSFILEHAEWFVKGYHCREVEKPKTDFQTWLETQTVVPDAR